MATQSGKDLKDSASKTIKFPVPFATIPHVVVSPQWENQHDEVDHAETIDTITKTRFTVVSNNAAPNYFVQWIAIG